jgi:hypothetical protein
MFSINGVDLKDGISTLISLLLKQITIFLMIIKTMKVIVVRFAKFTMVDKFLMFLFTLDGFLFFNSGKKLNVKDYLFLFR